MGGSTVHVLVQITNLNIRTSAPQLVDISILKSGSSLEQVSSYLFGLIQNIL